MTESKSQHTKADAKAAERRAAEELQNRRTRQLQDTRRAIPEREDDLRILQKNSARLDELSSHLDGFYEEINKLTKGKALLEVTPLMLEQANDIIRDSKEIIDGDTYLDRIKEFVPAGNNPVYPDVLVTLRAVQQSVKRYRASLAQHQERMKKALTLARTIGIALALHHDGEELPSRKDVQYNIEGGDVAGSCFYYDASSGESFFDFDRLDRLNLDECLSGTEEIENGGEAEIEEEGQDEGEGQEEEEP